MRSMAVRDFCLRQISVRQITRLSAGYRKPEGEDWVSYEYCSDMLPARRTLSAAAQYRR